MLGLSLEATKVYQEAKAEGRLEGKEEGRLEGKAEGRLEGQLEAKLEMAPILLEMGLTVEQIAERLGGGCRCPAGDCGATVAEI